MFGRPDRRSHFATTLHFAPASRLPSYSQLFAAAVLIAVGAFLGTRLVKRSTPSRPLRSEPIQEIDRWANEGGAVTTPAFPRPKPSA